MNRKMIKAMLSVAMVVSMDSIDNPLMHETKPTKKVTPPIPKGAKVWHEYGGVIAINETNAKRKFNKLKNNQQ